MKKCLFVFLLFIAFNAAAQDKYEYAALNFYPNNRIIQISIAGKSFEEIKVPKEQIKGYADLSAALIELNKLADGGWEVFDTGTTIYGLNSDFYTFTFYLKRKRVN